MINLKVAQKLARRSRYRSNPSPLELADQLADESLEKMGKSGEEIPGGLASGKKPADFDQRQLKMGIKVEMEHTPDKAKAREIAMDHLMEDPKYYTHLAEMEAKHAKKSAYDTLDDFAKGLPSASADVTPEKARQILHDGEVHGRPLTAQQRKFFGAIGGHLPAPKGKVKKAAATPEEEAKQEIEREKNAPQGPPSIPGVKPLPTRKSAVDDLADFAKGGLFIGPRGGRWADAKHTISYDVKQHGPDAGKGKGKGKKQEKESRVVSYTRDLDIRNIGSLPKGTGVRYLEVIEGEGGSYVAKQWRRKIVPGKILVDFGTSAAYKERRERVREEIEARKRQINHLAGVAVHESMKSTPEGYKSAEAAHKEAGDLAMSIGDTKKADYHYDQARSKAALARISEKAKVEPVAGPAVEPAAASVPTPEFKVGDKVVYGPDPRTQGYPLREHHIYTVTGFHENRGVKYLDYKTPGGAKGAYPVEEFTPVVAPAPSDPYFSKLSEEKVKVMPEISLRGEREFLLNKLEALETGQEGGMGQPGAHRESAYQSTREGMMYDVELINAEIKRREGAGKWYASKGDAYKEAVFQAMREIDAEAQRQHEQARRMYGPGGSVPVGAAHYDEFVQADAKSNVLSGIRQGMTPQEAAERAKKLARESVAKHNAQRSDVSWQRWEGTADTVIDATVARIVRGSKPIPERVDPLLRIKLQEEKELKREQERRKNKKAPSAKAKPEIPQLPLFGKSKDLGEWLQTNEEDGMSKAEEGGHKSPPKGYPKERRQYADQEGYKYPLDDEEHVRAAISYFSKLKNAGTYPEAKQKRMWGRIKSAAKKFGIELSDESGPPSVQKKESTMDKADDGKPGESLGETSTQELAQTKKDLESRLKSKPGDKVMTARLKAIKAELGKRTPPDFGGEAEKGCGTPGMKIRSGGKGRGLGIGGGKGPVGRMGKSGIDELADFAKGGPYIGPRGGKWADAEHTIPWGEEFTDTHAQERSERSKKRVARQKAKEGIPKSTKKVFEAINAGWGGIAVQQLSQEAKQAAVKAGLLERNQHGHLVPTTKGAQVAGAQAKVPPKLPKGATEGFWERLEAEGISPQAWKMSDRLSHYYDQYKQTRDPDARQKARQQVLSRAKKLKESYPKAFDKFHKDLPIGELTKEAEHAGQAGTQADVKSLSNRADALYKDFEQAVVSGSPPGMVASLAQTVQSAHKRAAKAAKAVGDNKTESKHEYYAKLVAKQFAELTSKSEVNEMNGIEQLAAYGQDPEDLEKAQTMPEGNPKQKLGQGEEQGGELAGVGMTSGSNNSGGGPGQDAQGQVTGTSTAKAKLSEDDEEDEVNMREHKKPIETAKSLTPARQRDMTAREHAQLVSEIRKGEGDLAVMGTGLAEQGEELPKLEKGRTGRQGMVAYSEQSDIETEALLKSQEFYTGGAPRVIPFSRPIGAGKVCPRCETVLSKSLTACPNCGLGAVIHQVVPGGEAQGDHDGELIVKSRAGNLRPRIEKDVKID